MNDWKLVKERNGIKIYVKHTDTSLLKTFKGVSEMSPKEPFSAIAALLDFENDHKAFHFVSDVELLKKLDDRNYLVRVHTLMPWPIKNREAIARINIEQNPETLDVLAHIENENVDMPVLQGYIRVPEFKGILGIKLLEEGKIEMTYEFVIDPGGYVPTWLVDIVLKDVPYYTLQKLKVFIDKPEYQGVRYDFLTYPPESKAKTGEVGKEIPEP